MLHGVFSHRIIATEGSQYYLVLYSDVVDALDSHPGSLNFYIGHELGHIQRKHLKWGPILFPASILPLLGAAYSRAREYTCDLYGLRCSESPADAGLALAVLAAGTNKWRKINLQSYADQSKLTGGFWMSFHELVSDYPWLVKRMEHIIARARGRKADIPRRHAFSWLLALFTPRLGVGGGGANILVFVAIIGILAAIAIPAYQQYTMRASASAAIGDANAVREQISQYIIDNQSFPASLEAIGVSEDFATAQVADLWLTEENQMVVQLNGPKQYTIIYTPRVEDGQLLWDCSGGTLPAKMRPPQCR